jgi:hypothetical protein
MCGRFRKTGNIGHTTHRPKTKKNKNRPQKTKKKDEQHRSHQQDGGLTQVLSQRTLVYTYLVAKIRRYHTLSLTLS